jgi:general secretion pathway protein D
MRRLTDLQVAVEVRFVTVSDRFFEQIGVDFDFDVSQAPCDPEFNSTGDPFPTGDMPTPLPNPIGQPNLLVLPAHTGVDFALFQLNTLDERQQLLNAVFADPDTIVYRVETVLTDGDVVTLGDPANQAQFAGWKLPGLGLTLKTGVTTDGMHIWVSTQPFYHGITPLNTFSPISGEMEVQPGDPLSLFPQNPQATARSASSVVLVDDGQTIVLGGLIRQPAPGDSAVAPLGALPVIRRLFSNVGLGRDRTELLIMVTPRIVIQEEQTTSAEDAENLRSAPRNRSAAQKLSPRRRPR